MFVSINLFLQRLWIWAEAESTFLMRWQAASQMLSLHSQAQETTELCTWQRDTPSPILHHQIMARGSLTWGKWTEIFQNGKWVKIASKVRFLLKGSLSCYWNSCYCLWQNRRRFITIFVLILSASLWFWQQPLHYHIHSLILLFSFWSIFEIS